jgi:hypothetical protein
MHHNSLSDSDPEIVAERSQVVVCAIVSLREPLPLQPLAAFVRYETETVDATLYHLHSIIIPPRKIHKPPGIYHLSLTSSRIRGGAVSPLSSLSPFRTRNDVLFDVSN